MVYPDEETDKGIYSQEGREELMENEDEITDVDEGFMKGYEEEEKLSECGQCNKVLENNVVEREFNDELLRFCSSECASEYEKNHQEQ